MKGLQYLKNKSWWNAALTRALKTAAQAAVSCLAVNTIWDIDVIAVTGVICLSAVSSLLMSLAGIPEINNEMEENKNE